MKRPGTKNKTKPSVEMRIHTQAGGLRRQVLYNNCKKSSTETIDPKVREREREREAVKAVKAGRQWKTKKEKGGLLTCGLITVG